MRIRSFYVQARRKSPDESERRRLRAEAPICARSALLGDPIPIREKRYYQAFYRDPDATSCTASGINATNAVLIGW
jgi:hypothetical protein